MEKIWTDVSANKSMIICSPPLVTKETWAKNIIRCYYTSIRIAFSKNTISIVEDVEQLGCSYDTITLKQVCQFPITNIYVSCDTATLLSRMCSNKYNKNIKLYSWTIMIAKFRRKP